MDTARKLTTLLESYERMGAREGFAAKILYKAEDIIGNETYDECGKELMRYYLRITSDSDFLRDLGSEEMLNRWAESTYKFIRYGDYTLLRLFDDRRFEMPDKPLFIDLTGGDKVEWTYKQIDWKIRETAAAFYSVEKQPRAAIFSDNCVDGACADLACLMYDIFDTPLNVHFNSEILQYIFDRLSINIACVDNQERLEMLLDIRKKCKTPFKIFCFGDLCKEYPEDVYFLSSFCKKFNTHEIDEILLSRIKKPINQVATTMFTSGSTGMPKGVSFSVYNLVTKRFARSAALPNVGSGETLLCYLPLFHTFGRYLELLGSIYWRATYVFAGNPSSHTLIDIFPKISPSVFISVPVRWVQLYEKCIELTKDVTDEAIIRTKVRDVIGSRLHWGLSAAGWLDPKIFKFFGRMGVNLCSGFGMTEATGGITMTPPGDYVENSTGKPLPGVSLDIGENNELLISGHYIARYLDEKGPGDFIPFPDEKGGAFKLPTGDIFQKHDNGHYSIVDRVKDIYKNNKGQTVAPRVVEQKFENVPGIKNTFLVGDGRAYNVLFIVPDTEDPVFNDDTFFENPRLYYSRIIDEANKSLAPYERVVNFAVLERNFSVEKGELTPKGSFNRKNIEQNFEDLINDLYKNNYIELEDSNIRIKIPRWFFRDLSILEDEITFKNGVLKNTALNKSIFFKKTAEGNIRIGSLEYRFHKHEPIDFGEFALQPLLWAGNPDLIDFAPCKEGWDSPMENVSEQIMLPRSRPNHDCSDFYSALSRIKNEKLKEINRIICLAFFGEKTNSLEAVNKISLWLEDSELRNIRYTDLLTGRLESLARHPEEDLRCLAYRILLAESPVHDYSKHFPMFIESGLTFLNEESIKIISEYKLERRRLESLRKRLATYRKTLEWPANDLRRSQFERIFKLLVNFIKHHPQYYSSVRTELSSWILHRKDPLLSKIAEYYFTELAANYENKLREELPQLSPEEWNKVLVFDDDFSPEECEKIRSVLVDTTFLEQSVILAFDEADFNLKKIIENGVWIMKIGRTAYNQIYRLSVNTETKHFDLQLVIREDLNSPRLLDTVYRLVSIAGYPFGVKVLSKLGCCRPELGARSMVYVNELTVWDKLREMASRQASGRYIASVSDFRKLYIEGMTAFFRGWDSSGRAVLPGIVSPSNVSIPEMDFMEGSTIRSLAGWREYECSVDLLKTFIKNFYYRAVSNYPRIKTFLDPSWIFDSAVEALWLDGSKEFFDELAYSLQKEDFDYFCKSMLKILNDYLEKRKKRYYKPLNLLNAIERYAGWVRTNPEASSQAKEDMVVELYRLYRLYQFPNIVRYDLFRCTYFAELDEDAARTFDKLLDAMSKDLSKPAARFYELSELQGYMSTPEDKRVFTRMVFPKSEAKQEIDFLKVGRQDKSDVFLRSKIKDKYGAGYLFRESVEPVEIGQLFRIFIQEKYPKTISPQDRFFVVLDQNDRIIGGLCYKNSGSNAILLDGTVIAQAFKGRGIARAMMESFFDNMSSRGIETIKTHFYFRDFYKKLGFRVDKSWGALVKFLEKN